MLVFGAIAPHGGDILEELAADPATMAKTRAAMLELGRRFSQARPETVVIATPHSIVIEGALAMGATKMAGGFLDGANDSRIEAVFDTDLELAALLAEHFEADSVPCAPLVGDDKKAEALFPLDWGALIPLWYTAHPLTPRPKVVVLSPDRKHLMRETLARAGVAIARAAAESGKRVAFIASCDLGHAHDPKGRYGFHPSSAEHDALFCEIVRAGDLSRLLEMTPRFLETAKVDAFWQALMLAGALGHTPLTGELLSYEAPTYFGMAVAAYQP